ncbi:PREDICTED: mitochondrial adenine nucleotide transporter ADNT1-like isoform X1 [Brassica oleracea var. oleracea]|uniref:mitochondrial adenine nucleotide transporter ADNT1-like isoform X1 n=1 Tax=Brassica oleracea var. oleracea TaxID=109376 RepID=UPI0006A74CD8|nr:PREDICTED: mitochondrial adenine nucleotide transporter ADNT1-like isoform X1 [Brassica oleracea var. oleracea]
MATEDVKRSESAAVSTIVNLAEEAREGVKAPSYAVLSICKSLFAGGVAGGSRTAVAPLERMKILLQVQNPHNIKSSGTVQGLKYIWRTEGLRGLFKGNGTNCARIVPNSAVKFFSYEQASKKCTTHSCFEAWSWCNCWHNSHVCDIPYGYGSWKTNCPGNFFVIARALLVIFVNSANIDDISNRLRTLLINIEELHMLCQLSCVRKVHVPCTVVPYVGLNFAVYESLKDWLVKDNPFGLVENNELTIITRLSCGAIAGTVGQTIAYPLDVIRRRMQMVGWKSASSVVTGEGRSKASLEYNGMVDAFRKTVRHEGLGALYKGLVPNSVKVVPSIAIAFVTYEMVKDVLGVEFRISD